MLPKKILFCADFSENSEPARQLAVEYANAFGAQLLIIHVVDTTGLPSYVDWVGDELNRVLRQTQKSGEDRLGMLEKQCRESVNDVKTICRVGVASKEIVSAAAEEAVDLIVMGTHGRSGVRHLVMGSVARSVLKTAHRPVLIVEGPSGAGESADEPYEYPVP